MEKSFRRFVGQEPNGQPSVLLEMPTGRGKEEMLFPTTQGMANLLSIIHGPWMRARALDWLMFDGLYQAELGRRKLCEQVNQAIRGELSADNIPGPAAHAGTEKVAMMRAEARFPYYHGEDPEEPGDETSPVKEADLFSPVAWERRPLLRRVRLNGLNIVDYYAQHYEPRWMVIDYQPGMKTRIDLNKAREFLEAHGLESFRYGGFDGYVQHVEKGDWLHPAYQRGFSNNEQHGYDLRIDDEGTDALGEPLKPITVDNKGRPVLHFVAGPFIKDERRSARTVQKMSSLFNDVAQRLEQGKDLSDMSPEIVDSVRNVTSLNGEVKKAEIALDTGNLYKAGASRILYDLDFNRGEVYFYVPRESALDMDAYLRTVRVGLSSPFKNRQLGYYERPEAFGPQWLDGQPEPPDGWWRQDSSATMSFKLGKVTQERFYKYVTDLLPSGILRVRFRMTTVFPECQPTKRDSKVSVSGIFNQGVRAEPEVAKLFKRVLYTAPDINPKLFVHQEDMRPVPVTNPASPQDDPVLQPFWDKGYRWEIRDGSERKLGGPNWERYSDGVLKLGTDRYVVVHHKGQPNPDDPSQSEPDQFFLMVPTGQNGKPLAPASYGQLGSAMLAGGVLHGGGKAGHIPMTPAGPQTWEQLQAELLAGGFGEPKPAHDLIGLSTVREAVRRAKFKFQRYTEKTPEEVNIDDSLLYSWAAEGLRAFSGDPAFQVGYVTPEEIEHILQWDQDREEEFGLEQGWGIQGLLADKGLVDAEGRVDADYWATLIDAIKHAFMSGPIIDYSEMPPEMQEVLGENAFQARVREVSKYIVARMSIEAKQQGHELEMSALSQTNDEGDRMDFDDLGQGNWQRGEWEADPSQFGHMDPKDLRQFHNIPEPESDAAAPSRPLAQFDDPNHRPDLRLVGDPDDESAPLARKQDRAPQAAAQAAAQRRAAPPRRKAAPAEDESAPLARRRNTPPPAPAITPAEDESAPLTKRQNRQPPAQPAVRPTTPTVTPAPAITPAVRPITPAAAEDESAPLMKRRSHAALENVRRWRQSIRETEIVFDRQVRPHDGCGWNDWGAPAPR